jgi:hypothetical protein
VAINEAAIGLMIERDKNLMLDPQIKEKEITTRKVILSGYSERYKSFLTNGKSTSGQPFNDALHFHSQQLPCNNPCVLPACANEFIHITFAICQSLPNLRFCFIKIFRY